MTYEVTSIEVSISWPHKLRKVMFYQNPTHEQIQWCIDEYDELTKNRYGCHLIWNDDPEARAPEEWS